MLNRLLHNQIAKFERRFGYDATYMHEIADISSRAFRVLWMGTQLSQYREDLPKPLWYIAKIGAARADDCGPCTQLVINMALQDGVDPAMLRHLLADEWHRLSPEEALVASFTKAVISHTEASEMREDIERRWGKRALVTLAFGIAGSRIYPQMKHVLGHAEACVRVEVDGTTVAVPRAA
ncbi:MAG: hypothetical protein GC199_11660 [Alphaproteobacteria bacterium]|nr:hypothetical protein [Alphaproteobacteria bacterium]